MKLDRKHFAELFRNDFKTVTVRFDPHSGDYAYGTNTKKKSYTYKVPKTTQVEVGDKLMVLVEGHTPEPKIVTVLEVHETPEINSEQSFRFKWIVGRFDDIDATRRENVERDQRIMLAVSKLEQAMTRVEIRETLSKAMQLLPKEDMDEIQSLFGEDLLPQIEGREHAP